MCFGFCRDFVVRRGDWDWETAGVWSVATREDSNSQQGFQFSEAAEALFDPTPAAYNPFSGGMNSNIERILVDVTRDNMMTLFMVDLKVLKPILHGTTCRSSQCTSGIGSTFAMNPSRMIATPDWTERIDYRFTDYQGDMWPFVSDVVNSSPTPDSSGDQYKCFRYLENSMYPSSLDWIH